MRSRLSQQHIDHVYGLHVDLVHGNHLHLDHFLGYDSLGRKHRHHFNGYRWHLDGRDERLGNHRLNGRAPRRGTATAQRLGTRSRLSGGTRRFVRFGNKCAT